MLHAAAMLAGLFALGLLLTQGWASQDRALLVFGAALASTAAAMWLGGVRKNAFSTAPQFVVLGTISVVLNTLVDIVVAMLASSVRRGILDRPSLVRRLREGSALVFCGLGLSLAFARRPS